MKQIYLLNDNNYFSYSIYISDEELKDLENNYIEHSWIDEGKTLFIPKWNGSEWIEGASVEEIEIIKRSSVKEAGQDEFNLDIEYRLSKLELGV